MFYAGKKRKFSDRISNTDPAYSNKKGFGEAKSEFDVIIKDTGPKKIEVIKAIRAITSLGLKDAKEMAEASDAKVLEAVGKEAAEDAKKQLEEAGATVAFA